MKISKICIDVIWNLEEKMMSKNYIFRLPLDFSAVIKRFKLEKKLSNDRTTIYQNDEMRFSFDQNVLRILVFNDSEKKKNELYDYFYGE